jgi:hypothetical protein
MLLAQQASISFYLFFSAKPAVIDTHAHES